MSTPIKPSDISAKKSMVYPTEVIDSFNELIAQNFVHSSSIVIVAEVVALIIEKSNGKITRTKIFEKGYLNVEEIYRTAGWKVIFDGPGYDGAYLGRFEFSC